MKARIKKVNEGLKETVVLYCIEEEKAAKITRILTGYNVKVLTAGVEDSGQALGTLFGLPEFPRREDAEVVEVAGEEMLFFGGFCRKGHKVRKQVCRHDSTMKSCDKDNGGTHIFCCKVTCQDS